MRPLNHVTTDGCEGLSHIPVLLNETVAFAMGAPAMSQTPRPIGVDATFGRGGHSSALLEAHESLEILGIDRDPDAHKSPQVQKLKSKFPSRLRTLQGPFSDVVELCQSEAITEACFICFDLGVSSPQLDEAERGFSFRNDGPLDMRMSLCGLSAADIVNSWSEDNLAEILFLYGEERNSRRIAAAIVERRSRMPILRTVELAELIASVQPRHDKIDPATRTFQALRIVVNNELEELHTALSEASQLLPVGGRLLVIAFHSLEDRIVKTFMRGLSRRPNVNRHEMILKGASNDAFVPEFRLIGGLIRPNAEDVTGNPRARSARLRVCERISMPPTQAEPSKTNFQNEGLL